MQERPTNDTYYVAVYDTISVGETVVVVHVLARLLWAQKPRSDRPLVSVEEYRKLLDDHASTDQQVGLRLAYIESLCRTIIRNELKQYGTQYYYERK